MLYYIQIDLSHNELQHLRVSNRSSSSSSLMYSYMVMIMSLDLSHNNISSVEVTFFEPVQSDLKILNMSRNRVEEISPDNIGKSLTLPLFITAQKGYWS